MKVPLLDLKPQYRSLKKELDEALIKVAESQYFILGPEVDEMEKEFAQFLGAKYALGVSSGTDALLLSLMALGIGEGDEVIVPTYSFFATAGVVARLNAKPVLADCEPVTMNIDPNDIEHRITKKTKAIIPVHLYGQSADMDAIMKIARKHNLYVIEDGAQAISAQYKDGRAVGTIGDFGCYSFFPSKNLGCFGDGGLIVTNNDKIEHIARIMRVHGGEPKYYHHVIGGNFRIDALQAAVLRVKLPHLNSWSQKRRENAAVYKNAFIAHGLAEETGKVKFDSKNKVLLPKAVFENSGHTNHHIYNQYIIRVEKRDELRAFLAKNEIASEIYYPVPFHLQKCFDYLGYKKGDFPNAEFAADKSLALPIFPELTDEQIEFVVEKIAEFVKK
ncbi:MAG: transcriptional regulator [Ignavibacteria bacterium CG2_30_36_16]|nr:DegT/DnrJ/EryC1/StrS family aminotransferase [Ignavibacteria bacterium]OIP59355.1 MAG: transcriptional regulator [Ignavibacteria bacterium CG2_30_36_16]PJA99947.1 MAG: transcriptional regulator [Ignavibacteria bacterium CG_4_9_14_3_um_filter_36_18]